MAQKALIKIFTADTSNEIDSLEWFCEWSAGSTVAAAKMISSSIGSQALANFDDVMMPAIEVAIAADITAQVQAFHPGAPAFTTSDLIWVCGKPIAAG